MKITLLVAIFVINCMFEADAFIVCGDDSYKKEVDEATTEIIKRFMGYRQPDWGWDSFTSVMAIQVTVPERLFGREKAAKALEERVKNEFDNIYSMAISAMAAKALCLNDRNVSGIDLLQRVADHVESQFSSNSPLPHDGFFPISIGLTALCVGRYQIKGKLVEKLLAGQNEDGSFGDHDVLSTTVKLLPPIYCLQKLPQPSYNIEKVGAAVAKMREYIISNIVNNDAGEVYIGDKLTTSLALIGLWHSKNATDDPARWRCRAAVMTLGLFPDPGEREYLLIWRLLRLHGAGFTDLADPGWKCVKTDPIPDGYQPTCVPDSPQTCEPKPEPK